MTHVLLAVQFSVHLAREVVVRLTCGDGILRMPKEWPRREATA